MATTHWLYKAFRLSSQLRLLTLKKSFTNLTQRRFFSYLNYFQENSPLFFQFFRFVKQSDGTCHCDLIIANQAWVLPKIPHQLAEFPGLDYLEHLRLLSEGHLCRLLVRTRDTLRHCLSRTQGIIRSHHTAARSHLPLVLIFTILPRVQCLAMTTVIVRLS